MFVDMNDVCNKVKCFYRYIVILLSRFYENYRRIKEDKYY